MKIIKDDAINYENNFYRIVNYELESVINENKTELSYGQILLCDGNRNDKHVFIVMNVDESNPSFEVYEPETHKPHIAGSSNRRIYDNLEDAYYDFLCRIIGFVCLDNIDDIKRYVIKSNNKEVNLNIRIPKNFDFKIKINQCSNLIGGYDKFIGETFNVHEIRQNGYTIAKYNDRNIATFITIVNFDDAEII